MTLCGGWNVPMSPEMHNLTNVYRNMLQKYFSLPLNNNQGIVLKISN